VSRDKQWKEERGCGHGDAVLSGLKRGAGFTQ